jgi:hypothetical protein
MLYVYNHIEYNVAHQKILLKDISASYYVRGLLEKYLTVFFYANT